MFFFSLRAHLDLQSHIAQCLEIFFKLQWTEGYCIILQAYSSVVGYSFHFYPAMVLLSTHLENIFTIVGRSIPDVCATCHIHATCQQSGGKSVCICNYGFVGNGRTHCQDKDECQIGASKICGNHTLCHNTHGSFYCVCLDGYRASNNNKTFIPNDGTNCTDIDECEESGLCGHNARCVNTEGSYMCYCNDGYKLETGEHSFHQDGNTVSCKEIGCGSPPEMKHGYIVGNYSMLPGSAVHYECQEGFYSNEGKFSYCTANETWEPPTLSCKGVDCGVPPSVLNAHPTSVSGTTYRSEVTYDCARGYLMAGGNRTAVCNARGHWDGPDLVCKEIDCGKPLLIPHTTMTWDNSTTLWSRVYYHCKEGYYFNGDRNFSECTIDQSWENITYVCKEEELLSNLSIFNETCVRWQRKTGRLGVQETYTVKTVFYVASGNWQAVDLWHNVLCARAFPESSHLEDALKYPAKFHILGQRLDEKIFSEDVIFNISTSEDNPRVCLDLNSGSNYMVNITTISSTNITVSVTLAIQTKVKEAFNNVLIFNDTCLKWRRNVRGTDMEDRYSFHIQGQRWYQKNFFHEMTFELSTHKQAPEVCLDLQPGTNYSINISMVALNFSLLVSMTTQISDPPFPEVEFVAVKGSAPLLRLRKAEDQNGPISSCLHSSVHPPPAAVACEALHLSTTVDMAQAGIASSFLETESVSPL
ncbi:PREDICTED: sushi domain-containing protein 1 isoform X3 [Sturnus vulgaris]|uniref:sushi domain-containing protein 1 isoform X3 n=1 Tax=Sturnus vulgaris TaxID=9172 RepID=UPI00071A5585|nr:PREDICTED: sushi domain-containing protein 1 isoform X3 [Sturnus vulgaris]